MTDGQLLDRFLLFRDAAAFEALVRRHGPMVLGVCRRMVGDLHDAEDAFQATFLVLVRKAASVAPREAVGNWLYGVAYRTALEARARNARRRARETQGNAMAIPAAPQQPDWKELRPILDQELNRLPARYRSPVILCDLEGRGRKEASRQLRLPEGTLSSRLARGRKMLAGRLTRRGVTFSAGALALTLAHNAVMACPPALTASVVRAGLLVAAGRAATAVVSARAAALTKGVLKTMFLSKVKGAMLGVLTVAVLGAGAGLIVQGGLAGRSAASEPSAILRTANREATTDGRDDGGRPTPPPPGVTGKLIAIGRGRQKLHRGDQPRRSRAEPQKADVKLTDKIEVAYWDVGPDGAKLTEGYYVQVWLADGSKDAADKVHLRGQQGRRAADVSGRVAGVAPNGQNWSLRLETRGRDNGAEVQVTDKSSVFYSNIAHGGAKPTEGYYADVWLEPGSKDTAARVSFRGEEGVSRDRTPEPPTDAAGAVVAVAKDGKSITVEPPAAARGETPTRQEIQIDDKTHIVYVTVGPDGDKPTEGYQALVWLAAGSKGTAGKVIFRGVAKGPAVLRAKVFHVSEDDRTLTLETPGPGRGDPPQMVDVKLTDKTSVVYEGVGPDGARLTAGYVAEVTLVEGSKDTAAQVVLSPEGAGRR